MAASPIKSFGIKDLLGISEKPTHQLPDKNIQISSPGKISSFSPTKPLKPSVTELDMSLPFSFPGFCSENSSKLDSENLIAHSTANYLHFHSLLNSIPVQNANNTSSELLSGSYNDLASLMCLLQKSNIPPISSNSSQNVSNLSNVPIPTSSIIPGTPVDVKTSTQISSSNHEQVLMQQGNVDLWEWSRMIAAIGNQTNLPYQSSGIGQTRPELVPGQVSPASLAEINVAVLLASQGLIPPLGLESHQMIVSPNKQSGKVITCSKFELINSKKSSPTKCLLQDSPKETNHINK